MWLRITDTSGQTYVHDYFPDTFLFEVIAMYLQQEGIYGADQEAVLKAFQDGATYFTSCTYTYTLIAPFDA